MVFQILCLILNNDDFIVRALHEILLYLWVLNLFGLHAYL